MRAWNQWYQSWILKNVHAKSIDIKTKICSPAESKPMTSWTQVSCTTHWTIRAVVFNEILLDFSLLLRLQPAAECNLITALTCGDKLEVEKWWVCGIRQLICRCRQSQASYRRGGQTDGQTDGFFSFINIILTFECEDGETICTFHLYNLHREA